MQENQVLRGLLRSLSSFIGEGAGGVLPKLGWDLNDFENFVNRAESDTAWESFQRNKRDKVNQPTTSTAPPSTSSRKRSGEDSATTTSRAKRPRGFTEDNERNEEYSLLVPPSGPTPNGFGRPTDQTMFNELMRNPNGSPMFMNNSPPTQAQFSAPSSGNLPFQQTGQPSQYLHAIGLDSGLTSVSIPSGPAAAPPRFNPPPARDSPELEDIPDPKRDEAAKLIQ